MMICRGWKHVGNMREKKGGSKWEQKDDTKYFWRKRNKVITDKKNLLRQQKNQQDHISRRVKDVVGLLLSTGRGRHVSKSDSKKERKTAGTQEPRGTKKRLLNMPKKL